MVSWEHLYDMMIRYIIFSQKKISKIFQLGLFWMVGKDDCYFSDLRLILASNIISFVGMASSLVVESTQSLKDQKHIYSSSNIKLFSI